jgi:hypothetical protein
MNDDINQLKIDVMKNNVLTEGLIAKQSETNLLLVNLTERIISIERKMIQLNSIKKMIIAVAAVTAIIIPIVDLIRHY